MTLFFISSLIALTVLPCYLLHQVSLTKKTLLESEQTRAQLEQLLAASDSELEAYIPNTKVIIEINDPIELAKREQPLTKYLSQVAPELIIKKVYEQIARELESGLKEKNVSAIVTVDKY